MDGPTHSELFALHNRITAHLAHDEKWHEDINVKLAANTEITTQVRDILASFRVIALVAKWLTVMGGAVAAIAAAWNAIAWIK